MKIDPHCQQRKCSSETLVCKDIRVMPICMESCVTWCDILLYVLMFWGIKWEWGRPKLPSLLLPVAIYFQTSYMRPKLLRLIWVCSPAVAFHRHRNRWPWITLISHYALNRPTVFRVESFSMDALVLRLDCFKTDGDAYILSAAKV